MHIARRDFMGLLATALAALSAPFACAGPRREDRRWEVEHTEDEWRALLTAQQFEVLRRSGTERAFSGAVEHRKGRYRCAGCAKDLFLSDAKFESGTGWPSFFQPIQKDAVVVERDGAYGMVRDEVRCARCGGHLGHVFDDGPAPTGLRYCMNAAALTFAPG